jgi:hypothetical protein
MSTGHGGRRQGAGRPVGSLNRATREIADRAAAEGVTPLEVQLTAMREFWQRAHANGEMDVNLAEKACQIARDCASFVHPRLASVEARIDAIGRVEVGIEVIRQEQRLLDLAFGELHLMQRSSPIPKFVEAVEAVENAEPMSGDDGKDEAADGS